MSIIERLSCDGCGAKGEFREGTHILPKGWGHVRVTPSSSQQESALDLCEKCFSRVRVVIHEISDGRAP